MNFYKKYFFLPHPIDKQNKFNYHYTNTIHDSERIKMKKIDNDIKVNVGVKLTIFRKAIKKSREELAGETGFKLKMITAYECGEKVPEIDFLHFLSMKYNLNINWILGGESKMFIKEQPKDIDAAYVREPLLKNGLPFDKKYSELFLLMEIPDVERFIFDKLGEIKTKLRDG